VNCIRLEDLTSVAHDSGHWGGLNCIGCQVS
jgi:hypothetical protein